MLDIAVISSATAKVGLLLGAVGALVTTLGVVAFLREPNEEHAYRQRWWTLAGSLLLALGFIVQLVAKST